MKPLSAILLICVLLFCACHQAPVPLDLPQDLAIGTESVTADTVPYNGEQVSFSLSNFWPADWPKPVTQTPLNDASGELTLLMHKPVYGDWITLFEKPFNKIYPNVTLITENGMTLEDPYGTHFIEAIITRLTGGDPPDLIDLGGQDFQTLAHRGFFIDLYTFIDTDKDLLREDFYPDILKAMETDGKLYRIAPFIEFYCVKVHRDYYDLLPEYLKLSDTISFDEMVDVYRDLKDEYDEALKFRSYDGLSNLAYELLTNPKLVDYANQNTGFDADFIHKAALLTAYEPKKLATPASFSSDLFTIESTTYFSTLANYLPSRSNSHTGRWLLSDTDQATIYHPKRITLCIPNNAKNPDLAWEYIKCLLTSDPQMDGFTELDVPFMGNSIHRPSFFKKALNSNVQLYVKARGETATSRANAVMDVLNWLDAHNQSPGRYTEIFPGALHEANDTVLALTEGTITPEEAARRLTAYFLEQFRLV